MADQYLRDLQNARSALVNSRRNWAKTLANPGARSGQDARNFTEFQAGIEAIDRAIKDEEKLKSIGH